MGDGSCFQDEAEAACGVEKTAGKGVGAVSCIGGWGIVRGADAGE